MNTVNIFSSHPDIIWPILQHTDISLSLREVCKAFAHEFFDKFFQICLNSPSLKDRVQLIQNKYPQNKHSNLSSQRKIRIFYNSIKVHIQDISKAKYDDVVKEKGLSIKRLQLLENWLEDMSTINFFTIITGHHSFSISTFLSGYQTSKTSELIHDICCGLFRNQKELATITGMAFPLRSSLMKGCLTIRSDIKFAKLPKEIGLFTQLRILHLSKNAFITLPKEIGCLTQLHELHVDSNQLASLPQEIGNLTQLRELNACYNLLTSLPQTISKLSRLKNLSIVGNPISSREEVEKLVRPGLVKWEFG